MKIFYNSIYKKINLEFSLLFQHFLLTLSDTHLHIMHTYTAAQINATPSDQGASNSKFFAGQFPFHLSWKPTKGFTWLTVFKVYFNNWISDDDPIGDKMHMASFYLATIMISQVNKFC